VNIPFVRPRLPDPQAIWPRLQPSYAKHWFSNFGPVHQEFQASLQRKYCPPGRSMLLTSNCTVGIAAALVALNVRGRVAIPSFTFPATAQAVLMAGCEPVYIESDPLTWHVSAEHVAVAIEKQDISAVIAVRAFGFCIDLSPLEQLCRAAEIPLIIDSAAALGGTITAGSENRIGAQGDVEVFSLHATKVFAIGEGGAISAPPQLLPELHKAINFGIFEGRLSPRGFNGKLCEFSCAVGLAVLETIDHEIERRRAVTAWYDQLFSSLAAIRPGAWAGVPPWQTYPVLTASSRTSETLAAKALELGIQLRRYYSPALHRAYCTNPGESPCLPVTDRLADCMLCFPVLADMTESERSIIQEFCLRHFNPAA
jgi:dTDP-4-amino-4,6-dideoxygalactose transaminase